MTGAPESSTGPTDPASVPEPGSHDAAVWAAYRSAHLRIDVPGIGAVVVRPEAPGTTEGRFPLTGGSSIHVVTGHNPGGRVVDGAANARAHARLLAPLRAHGGLTLWPAVGGDPSWTHTETSVAVVGLSDETALAIGCDFGQDAIFAWTPSALTVLPCQGTTGVASGWSVDEIGAGSNTLQGPSPEGEE